MARRTQAERRETTQSALVTAGRELFAEHGFGGVGTEAIAERAGLSKGAIHHHFGTKEGLFAAVVESLEADVCDQVLAAALKAAAAGADPAERLRVGCLAFLDACLEPAVRRVVLLDGPAVLGWQAWREIDERYGLALVRQGLQDLVDAGAPPFEPSQLDPLAHLLLGALNEAALLVANADKPRRARTDVGRLLGAVLDRLLAPRPA